MTTPREVIDLAETEWPVSGYPHVSRAEFILAALEAAAYSVVKLEQVGWLDTREIPIEGERTRIVWEKPKRDAEELLFRVVSDQPRGEGAE